MADWGNLPKDLVTKIAEHLDFFEDFEAMSETCSGWRLAAKEAKIRGSCDVKEAHTLPWLMLPETDESSNIRRFYSVSKRMVREISLLDDLAISRYHWKRLLSSHGWLLVVSEEGNNNKLSLFNPFFSKPTIELPEINNIKVWTQSHIYEIDDYMWDSASLNKFVLSADPCTNDNFVVFLSCEDTHCYPESILLYWKKGDHGWTRVIHPVVEMGLGLHGLHLHSDAGFLTSPCRGVTFYQGEFYGVNFHGLVVKFETSSQGSSFKAVTKLLEAPHNTSVSVDDDVKWFYHLVESRGQLLVVRQVMKYEKVVKHYRFSNKANITFHLHTVRFEVFELDVDTGNVKQVPSLKKRAIFLGLNSNFSVDASYSPAHGLKPNCIYYTNQLKGPGRCDKCHCAYNLNDGEFERSFYEGPSAHLGKLTRLMWVESPK